MKLEHAIHLSVGDLRRLGEQSNPKGHDYAECLNGSRNGRIDLGCCADRDEKADDGDRRDDSESNTCVLTPHV